MCEECCNCIYWCGGDSDEGYCNELNTYTYFDEWCEEHRI